MQPSDALPSRSERSGNQQGHVHQHGTHDGFGTSLQTRLTRAPCTVKFEPQSTYFWRDTGVTYVLIPVKRTCLLPYRTVSIKKTRKFGICPPARMLFLIIKSKDG